MFSFTLHILKTEDKGNIKIRLGQTKYTSWRPAYIYVGY